MRDFLILNGSIIGGAYIGGRYAGNSGFWLGLIVGTIIGVTSVDQADGRTTSEGLWLRQRATFVAIFSGLAAMAITMALLPQSTAFPFIAYIVAHTIGIRVAEKMGWCGEKADQELVQRLSFVRVLAAGASVEGTLGSKEKNVLQYAHRQILGPLGYGGEFELNTMLTAAPVSSQQAGEFLKSLPADQQISLQILLLGVLYAHGRLTPARSAWLQELRKSSVTVDWSILRAFDRTVPDLFDQQRQQCYAELSLLPGVKDESQIKDAYRRKASQYHPDKHSNLAPQIRALAEAKMATINAAYRALLNDSQPGTMPLRFRDAEGRPIEPSAGLVSSCWLCSQKNRLPVSHFDTARCGQCSALLGIDFEMPTHANSQPEPQPAA